MDLARYRNAIGGATVFFGLVVAWMMPPTDPRPVAPNWRQQVKPIRPPAASNAAGEVPAAFVGAVPAAEPAQPIVYRPRPAPRDESITDQSSRADSATVNHGQAANGASMSPPAEVPNPDDTERRPLPRQPSFRDGYRWAEAGNLIASRGCRAASGEAGENGCLAYLRSRPGPSDNGDEVDDERPSIGPDDY